MAKMAIDDQIEALNRQMKQLMDVIVSSRQDNLKGIPTAQFAEARKGVGEGIRYIRTVEELAHRERMKRIPFEQEQARADVAETLRRRQVNEASGLAYSVVREGPDSPTLKIHLDRLRELKEPALAADIEHDAIVKLKGNVKKISDMYRDAGVPLEPGIKDTVSKAMAVEGGIEDLGKSTVSNIKRLRDEITNREVAETIGAKRVSEAATLKEFAQKAAETEALLGLEAGAMQKRIMATEEGAAKLLGKRPGLSGMAKTGLIGGGALMAYLLASKLFGGKDEGGPQISPEMQMLLAQKLQGDQGTNTSQTLRDMSKMLGIMKMLQDVQGMQPQPTSLARIM